MLPSRNRSGAADPFEALGDPHRREILGLLRTSVDTYGQTTVMVTHDPQAAAIADRVLFLADGEIVRDVERTSARDIVAVMEELSR